MRETNRILRIVLFVCCLACVTAGPAKAFAADTWTLTITEQTREFPLLRCRILTGEIFHMRTIHSLALTRYVQVYRITEEGEIMLSGAIYESEGGGFPALGDGILTKKDGKYYMDKMDRLIGGTWSFRVSPFSQETFVYREVEVPLFRILPEGTVVLIRIEKERNKE